MIHFHFTQYSQHDPSSSWYCLEMSGLQKWRTMPIFISWMWHTHDTSHIMICSPHFIVAHQNPACIRSCISWSNTQCWILTPYWLNQHSSALSEVTQGHSSSTKLSGVTTMCVWPCKLQHINFKTLHQIINVISEEYICLWYSQMFVGLPPSNTNKTAVHKISIKKQRKLLVT
jgi:hypothetical protein